MNFIFCRRLIETIEADDLKVILAPLKEKLAEKNSWFEEDNKIPENLSCSLRETADDFDEKILADVAQTLSMIHSIAISANSEHIKSRLGDDFNKDDSLQKQVCKLLRKPNGQGLCEEIMAINCMEKTYNGYFYMPSISIKKELDEKTEAKIKALSSTLSDFFDDEGKSNYVFISTHRKQNLIYACIEHGNSKTISVVIDGKGPRSVLQRPFVQDVIRLNCKTGEMVIHLEEETKKTIKKYKHNFGNVVIGNSGEYLLFNKFRLEPLKKGRLCLDLKELNEKISHVAVNYFYFRGTKKNGKIGGIECLEEAERLGKEGVEFTSANFSFKFSKKVDRKVTISDGNKAKIPLCPEHDIIESFFIQNKFFDTNRHEKTLDFGSKK